MVHSEPSERKKYKPRGRPFGKGNHKGKPSNDVLDASGRESSVERHIVAPEPKESIVGQANGVVMDNLEVKDGRLERIDESKPVNYEQPTVPKDGFQESAPLTASPENEIVESITFADGPNTLKIVLSKRHNRMYRLQVFLNGDTEIRPSTYTGASMAYNYWNLLKNSLKK